jgi:type I restriction enzyme S subunit
MEILNEINRIIKYQFYKDSGVAWLGHIPEHWLLTRLGTRFKERRTKVSDKDYEALSVTKNGIVPQLEDAAKTNDGDNRKQVLKGDFVINSRSDRKGSSGVSPLDGSVSLINIVLEPIDIHPFYCNYLLKSYNFIEEFYRMGHGIVADLWTTRYDEMRAIMIGIPPLSEQTAIANFLDRKTALIDQAISMKEKQIELLKERKQILIQKAVTRGLNPNVKLKDSGVEWIGEIPEHWEVVRSKTLFSERKERARESDVQLTSSQKFGVIPQEKYMAIEGRRVTQVEFNREIQKHVEKGDFMISMRSFQGGIEYSEYEGCISSAYVSLVPCDLIVSSYYKYLLKSDRYIEALQSTSNLVRDGQALRYDNFKQIDLLKVPKDEQISIANYIEKNSTNIATAITFKEQEIEKLKEYKSTLINSAVTGKIKVC